MLSVKSSRRKDSLVLLALISSSMAGVAFMTIVSPSYINAVTNNASNTTTTTANNLITNILAKNLENHLQKAAAILEITSKLPQVRNIPFAHLLNQTLSKLHGIPQGADIEKRQLVSNIISSSSDLYDILLVMPNGDIYFVEPYSIQKTLAVNNFAFRDYFQGAIKTNDTYLGNVHTTLRTPAAFNVRTGQIAVPVYSLKDNSTIIGVWAGGIDFNVLNKELQSLSLDNNTRIVYVDSNGQKVADSNISKSKTPESFATLNSFKNAINGKAGSTTDIVNNTKMLVTYQPVKVFHNTWSVLLMQPS